MSIAHILGLLFVAYIIVFIPLTIYFDKLFSKIKDENSIINVLIFMIVTFCNPLTAVISFLIAGSFFEGTSVFDKGITTLPRIGLFIVLSMSIGFIRFVYWSFAYEKNINSKSYTEYGKNVAFQIPFFLFVMGFFQYWNGELQIPGISLWLLISGIFYTFVFSYFKNK